MRRDRVGYARLFSESLRVVTGEIDRYACPLCLRRFPTSEAQQLIWDHYPPQSVGGRDANTVLICRACKDKWDPIDVQVDRLKKRDEFKAKYPKMEPVVLSFEAEAARGLEHREAFAAGEAGFRLVGRPEANSPAATARLVWLLNELSEKGGFQGLRCQVRSDDILSYSPRKVELSFLKAAYLAAFQGLGYPYILAPQLEVVRQQVLQPELNLLTGYSLVVSPKPRGAARKVLLAYVREPKPLTGLAVLFIGYHLNSWSTVFLPLPARPGFPEYGRLVESIREVEYAMRTVIFDPSRDTIMDPDLVLVSEDGMEWPIYGASGQTDVQSMGGMVNETPR